MQKNVTILGSTGTIGQQTLDVIARHPSRFKVFAIAARNRIDQIYNQCLQYQPNYVVLLDIEAAKALRDRLKTAGSSTTVLSGMENLKMVASHPEVQVVMAAIVGAAGLEPALAAAQNGKTILLANKETLVMAGQLFMDAIHQSGATLLPIDSEHNAIFQAMPTDQSDAFYSGGVRKIILTASGGPFRTYSQNDLTQVTTEMALKHPNWIMGAKITIDSATLMNKGLEVIEAHWLFNAHPSQIEVVVHPQSVIHSMVEYIDGSVLAQLGNPDMRTPIAYGLGYPERIASGVASLNLIEIAKLEFEAPDTDRFPCLRLAYEALEMGGTAPAILNAANEIAVSAFLNKEIRFLDIPQMIERTLQALEVSVVHSLEQLLEVDKLARQTTLGWISGLPQRTLSA